MTETIVINSSPETLSENPINAGETQIAFEGHLRQDKGFYDEEITTLRKESVQILSRSDFSSEVGLCVGKIQSGKTTSFTSVCALARDNNIPICIVLGGTNNTLLDQATKDLENLVVASNNPIKVIKAQRAQQETGAYDPSSSRFISTCQSLLDSWVQEDDERLRQSLIITVMKQHANLNNFNAGLQHIDFREQKVLIIDDECDQYGLNTSIREEDNQESSTNILIDQLRDIVPNHTYLGYTATPQANMMLPLGEILRPSFVCTVSPGKNYVGGKDFFPKTGPEVSENPLVRIVPQHDSELEEMPADLINALMVFIVGKTVEYFKKGDEFKPFRSMLVHPSHLTFDHYQYFSWIKAKLQEWNSYIEHKDRGELEKEDYQEMIEEFKEGYEDILSTVNDPHPFDEEFHTILGKIVKSCEPIEVNIRGGATPRIDWRDPKYRIIVAGQAVDRGTVVRNLTITYLSRPPGVGYMDTIEQRARFYGYKKDYLEYCRVYCSQEVAEHLADYVFSEDDMWERILAVKDKPFNEIRSEAYVPLGLKQTNPQKHMPTFRLRTSDGWISPSTPHHPRYRDLNRRIIKEWLDLNLQNFVDWGQNECNVMDAFGTDLAIRPPLDDIAPFARHQIAEFSLREVWEGFLGQIQMDQLIDNNRFGQLTAFYLNAMNTDEEQRIKVFLMGSGTERMRRTKDFESGQPERNQIQQYYAGRTSGRPWYPGDRNFFDSELYTLQIHHLAIRDHNDPKRAAISDVWGLTLHTPRSILDRFLIEGERLDPDDDPGEEEHE